MAFHAVGLDLGQSSDPTALSVLACHGTPTLARRPYVDAELGLPGTMAEPVEGPPAHFGVVHLERLPLGTSYDKVVAHVVALMRRLPGDSLLVVDHTGVGRGPYDYRLAAGLPAGGISIHGGEATTGDGMLWRVPKKDLVMSALIPLQTGRLKIASSLPLAATLVDELLNFKMRVDPQTIHMSFEARQGAHDDLVLSVSIATWLAERIMAALAEGSGQADADIEQVHISPV